MDEIVTKSNLDSFTQGLKGVLDSMGLEINSKAGNTAVSVVGAKVDTVDSKIDTLNTKATTIDGKCDQVVNSIGDVDFSQFVTRDYLNYMLNPKWRVFGTIYYSDESNTQRTLLYSTAEMSKVLLSYSGSTTAYCYNTGEYLSDSLWENESSSDFSVSYNNYAEIDFNENPYLILDKYYYFCFQLKWLGYVEKTESIDDSDVHYYRYPYKLNSLGASYMNSPNGIYLNRMKIIITSESNSINVNNIVITILGKKFKNGEYFYLADYYGQYGYYNNGNYSYSYFHNTNECVDTLDYSNIVVPDIEGFHYQLSINAHCICINYYIPTNTYNDVVTFNSNSSGSSNCCGEKYFYYNLLYRYLYYKRDPITFNSKTHFTTYVLPKSVNEIINDIHSYVGTWDSTNNKMKLRQLDDSNNNKYSNGTNVASSNLYEFIRIPKFYIKSSSSSYNMTSSHNVTIYYDKTLQSQPEGDGWKERGGNLIGRYCTPSNSFTCGRGYTAGTRTSNSGKPSYLDTMSLIDFSTIVLLLSIKYGWTILQPFKTFFNLESLNVILDINTSVNVPTSGTLQITSPYTISIGLSGSSSSNTTQCYTNIGFGTIGTEVLFTPYYYNSTSYYISNIPKHLNIKRSTSQYTGGLYMDFFYGAEINKSSTARYFRLVYNGNYTIIS